jgi:hypothetical protein
MPERVDREALKKASHADQWRLIGAAACLVSSPCFISMIVTEAALLPRVLGAAGIVGALVGLVLIFRADRYRPPTELEQAGLTVDVPYSASRCLQLEEVGDYGPLYLIRLGSGEALFMGGQWLAEWEAYEDAEEPSENAPRRFPCTEFVVVRRKDTREVVDLHCSGTALEPEAVRRWDFERPDRVELPVTGDILPAGAFEDLLQHLPTGHLY